ncbi:MAG: PDZ domain-containing protein, partial [Clostridia bacterium]|nr:PDZ domain-containing protein [Clostridia bacterium]
MTEECSTTIEKADNSVRINSQNAGEYEYSYRLFNTIPIKQVNVSVVPKRYVIPSGETIGVKIYTKGLLVIDVSAVYAKDMTEHFPARDAGIAVGDRIMSVDGIELKTNEEFAQYINSVKTKVKLKIARDDTEFETEITPVMSNDNDIYKVGLWVRDSTAGIGTLTCYDLQTGEYAALGHAICDSDTGEIMTVSNGGLINCKVVSIQKAQSGKPGELTGA